MNNPVYPSVLQFKTVAKFLGLEDTYSYSATSVEFLLRHINEHDIPIYLLDSEIYGVNQVFVEQSCYIDEETGGIQQLEPLNAEQFYGADPFIKITLATLIKPLEDIPTFTVSAFEVQDSLFRASDEEGTLQSLTYTLDNLYFRRDDITKFKEQFQSAQTISAKETSSNFSQQDKRELAFQFWLSTKAASEKKSTDQNQLNFQECYAAIGSPTRKTIWNALKEIDKKLFAQGEDDFFKKQNLIQFRKGTGAQR